MPPHRVRDAVWTVLSKSSESASVRDLTTAVYYFLDDDRVGYTNVAHALEALARDFLVERLADGTWQAVLPVTTSPAVGR